ncbi:MAG: methyltransferase regulatory domain-containing protein [Thermoguttaceae bacterium]
MADACVNSYDEVPYNSFPHTNTHPRHLQALATLFGLEPPPLPACRVLELGCAAGGNLIPLADDLPESRLLGVDLSARQIDDGRANVAELGFSNVELRQADVCRIDESWGLFDYILCYGVYSWVPQPVQQRILDICRQNLVPNGVAIVSYNTYPGWRLRGLVRDLMRYHVDPLPTARQKIAQAHAVLDFMASACDESLLHGQLLKRELELLRGLDGSYLYHEHLEDYNQPVYFHEFIELAEEHGLQYLAEANVSRMGMAGLPERVQTALAEAPMLRREQYLDFLRNIAFRETLLCHREQQLDRQMAPQRLGRFWVQLSARPDPVNADLAGEAAVRFGVGDHAITVSLPLSKAAIASLARAWPQAMRVEDLYCRSLEMLGQPATGDPRCSIDVLCDMLMTALEGNVLEIYMHPPRCVSTIEDRPVASRVARWQAGRRSLIANCWHRPVRLDDLACFILQRLDGRRDRPSLQADLRQAFHDGLILAGSGEKSAPPPPDDEIARMVDWALDTCVTACSLIG